MPLFRRGNQLLRLGTGLRDCCCRPENPEECFCPDSCRYYFRYADLPGLGPGYLRMFCSEFGGLVGQRVVVEGAAPFGFATGPAPSSRYSVSVSPGVDFTFGGEGTVRGLEIQYSHSAGGGYQTEVVRQPNYNTFIVVGAYPLCVRDDPFDTGPLKAPTWRIEVRVAQSASDGVAPVEDSVQYYSKGGRVAFDVPGTCVAQSLFFCEPSDANSVVPRLHLLQNINIAVTMENVTVNGLTKPLEQTFLNTGAGGWQTAGYPFTGTANFVLQGLSSCKLGPCNCNVNLAGKLVEFEGRTFTFGSLEQFISDDGLTIWEEGPQAGRFTREDRRECDSTVSMRIRTAEVSCSTFDGVPRWFAYLDSECYEHEDPGCSPVRTAFKITLFSGAFFCNEDGTPSGSPRSFLDDRQPPDLDEENISGTPSADCDFSNPIPSIFFR